MTNNINRIDLYATNIKINLLTIILYLSKFYTLKNVLFVKRLAASKKLTLKYSIMSQKRSFVTVTKTLRPSQIMNKIYNTGLSTIKLLTKIKA